DALATPPGETDMNFCAELVRGVSTNAETIDDVIKRAMADGRTPEKLETVLRTILRAGAYEIGQRRDIDPPVTISEFVGLAERFFADREPALVNGLLDRIARDLRPEDMAENAGNDGQR
ncbi:MAG TPA: transcription antitermination factor NusB, partial [Rhodospirillaceae bacterium]|nr:transcription antitermination factor NusB [Rhodospirillaceae bacterium]